jgi:hypothetical protein
LARKFPDIVVREPIQRGTGALAEQPGDGDFVAMLNAYRGLGGLARAQEVASMMMADGAPGITAFAERIISRKLLSFEWQSQIWIPLFQFDKAHMSLQPGISVVLQELSATMEPWEQAIWFSQPNLWLAERCPAELLRTDRIGVMNAASATRFLPAD